MTSCYEGFECVTLSLLQLQLIKTSWTGFHLPPLSCSCSLFIQSYVNADSLHLLYMLLFTFVSLRFCSSLCFLFDCFLLLDHALEFSFVPSCKVAAWLHTSWFCSSLSVCSLHTPSQGSHCFPSHTTAHETPRWMSNQAVELCWTYSTRR